MQDKDTNELLLSDLKQPMQFYATVTPSDSFLKELICYYYEIYFVPFKLFNSINLCEVSNRFILIPTDFCDGEMIKIVNKNYKAMIFNKLNRENKLSLYIGKKDF